LGKFGGRIADDRAAEIVRLDGVLAAQAIEEPKLDKPAKVGNGTFGIGIKWSTVIRAAQRLYEFEVTPEKEAERIAKANESFAEFKRHVAQVSGQDREDAERLDWLRDTCCDLRSVNVPTGGDDAEVHWVVIEHHMAKPHERESGMSITDGPRGAIDAARAAAKGE